MKIALLVTGGRGGSDFFQGLLDGHSQILQFPGKFDNENIFEVLNLKKPEEISKKFINLYPEFFNSKLNKIERHDCLGQKKNKYYKISQKKFLKNFEDLFKKKKNFSKIEILTNLHIAYFLTKKKRVSKKKFILIHTHLVKFTKKFIKFMHVKDLTIIHTMRNPLSALNSPFNNWLKYQGGKYFFPKNLYFQLDLVFNGIFDLLSFNKRLLIIQYEHLHWHHKKVMNDFCKIFKIRYENCMKIPTYHGLRWWGDVVSNKWVSGINKNFSININEKLFYKRDIKFFEFLTTNIIKFYKYKFFLNKEDFYFNLLPMKCEILVWKNVIKHKKWKHILSIPFFYCKRIFLFNKFTIKKFNFPYSVGSK